MTLAKALSVEVVPSIHDIGPEAWNTLETGHNLYLGYPWLSCLNLEPGYEPRHLVVRRPDGRLVAATPAYRWTGMGGRGVLLDPYFQFVEPALPGQTSRSSWFPVLLAGGLGPRNGFLYTAGLERSERQSATRALLNELTDLGQRLGCVTVVLMYLDRDTMNDVHSCISGQAKIAVLGSLPDTVLPIDWASFDGYVASLTANRRRSVLQELLRFQRNGCQMSTGSLSEWTESIARLVSATRSNQGKPQSLRQTHARLRQEAHSLDPISRVFLCHIDDRLLAASVTFEWDGCLYVRDWGFDHNVARPNFEYFVMQFYAPIQYAIERSLSAVYFGPVGYEAKLRRGLRPDPRFSVVLSAPRLPAAWRRQSGGWNDAFNTAFRRNYAPFMDARARLVDLAP